MSLLGHCETSECPKADIAERGWEVCFVPEAEVAVIRSVELVIQPDVQDVVGGCCAVVQLH
jgi:hypothetical protein